MSALAEGFADAFHLAGRIARAAWSALTDPESLIVLIACAVIVWAVVRRWYV